MKMKLLISAVLFVPMLVQAEEVGRFDCKDKTISLYNESHAVFIDSLKTDDVKSRELPGGHMVDFRIYAEMGGTYTQYQLTVANNKATLTSQWMNADGDPLRATDVANCQNFRLEQGAMPNTKSVMEMIRSGELE